MMDQRRGHKRSESLGQPDGSVTLAWLVKMPSGFVAVLTNLILHYRMGVSVDQRKFGNEGL